MKKMLVIYYSQSGQLKSTIDSFLSGFMLKYEIDMAELKPIPPFPFPWTWFSLFNTFPETVNQKPCELAQLEIKSTDYDLVVLAFQTWFLHPSIPMRSFIQSETCHHIVKDRNVILLMNCRNTWRNAMDIIRGKIQSYNGRIIASLVLKDTAGNLTGGITIMDWLLTGKKRRLFGIFPMPGVSPETIKCSKDVSSDLLQKIDKISNKVSDKIIILPKSDNEDIMEGYEQNVIRIFRAWARYADHPIASKRKKRVILFMTWLILAIMFIAPFTFLALHLKVLLRKPII
jgi:hypothetical protein